MITKRAALITGAVLILIAVLAVPVWPRSYTTVEKYQVTETYTEREAYTDSEPYEVEVPITYEQPYQHDVEKSTLVINQEVIYTAFGEVKQIERTIDLTGKKNPRLEGTVRVISGGDSLFRLFDAQGQKYVEEVVNSEYVIKVVPQHSGLYTFQSDNSAAWLTNRYLRLDVTLSWQETVNDTRTVTEMRKVTRYEEVTKYRDIVKEALVWKERPVTHQRRVALVTLLLGRG